MNKTKLCGSHHEDIALDYLQKQGLSLVERNFYSRFGEIDLIMNDQGDLVFVEVKFRHFSVDSAIESINYSKQKKLIQCAKYYLLKCDSDCNCRFDAVAIDSNQQIQWLKNIITL